MDMSGKVAIVTGGGGQTGLAVADTFISAGATVVIAEIDALAGAMAADALEGKGQVYFIDGDVASEPSVKAVVERVLTAYGRIDCLVNCASLDRRGHIGEMSMDDWHRVMGVNLTGPFLYARHCAEKLAEASGAIVNIVSSRPHLTDSGCEAYAASKAGLVGLTQSLAVTLAPRVRVNCISPDWAKAGDSARAGSISADQIAQTALKLCAGVEDLPSGHSVTLEAA